MLKDLKSSMREENLERQPGVHISEMTNDEVQNGVKVLMPCKCQTLPAVRDILNPKPLIPKIILGSGTAAPAPPSHGEAQPAPRRAWGLMPSGLGFRVWGLVGRALNWLIRCYKDPSLGYNFLLGWTFKPSEELFLDITPLNPPRPARQ